MAQKHESKEVHFHQNAIIQHTRTALIKIGRSRCGKGTQSKEMRRLGIPLLETGEMIRELRIKEPEHPEIVAMEKGEFASDDFIVWRVKKWAQSQLRHNNPSYKIVLDGVVRNTVQARRMIPFFKEKGFVVKCAWYTPIAEVCNARPPRNGREKEDNNPVVLQNKERAYVDETLPVLDILSEYGISEEKGTLLFIDNTNLTPRDVAEKLIPFVGFDFTPDQMFPASIHHNSNGQSRIAA